MSNLSDDEGLFDDIYGDDDVDNTTKKDTETETAAPPPPPPAETESSNNGASLNLGNGNESSSSIAENLAPLPPPPTQNNEMQLDPSLLQQLQQQLQQQVQQQVQQVQHQRATLSRDAGKMFIGGLNWETSEDSLRLYFEKFGEIIDLTIMKDSNTGKSRGFGFLTFAEPSSVDEVVKTSHVLDGKLIDPKRAIPKEEQDKTGKIFVGGIAPEVNEGDFNDYFSQFGHIIDAQLMIDKDTGRSRGFGFVTYDTPEAVDKVTENKYVMLKGRNMEIKRAEPRGQQNSGSNSKYFQQQQYQSGQLDPMANPSAILNQFGVNGDMAQQYWQQMQQYFFQQMQQQYAANGMTMDPAMMQQYQYLQQQQQQQQQQYAPQQQQQQQQQDYNQYDSQQQYDDQDQVVNIQQQQLDNIPKQPKLTLPPRDVPANVPKGPKAGVPPSRGGGYRGRGGRGRGGYRPRGTYHPYGR